MSQENVDLAQRVLGHWAATGELLWDTAHPEVEVHDHDAPDQGDYRGREGIERWLRDWGDAWAEWTMDLDEFIDAGDSVVVFVRMKAQGRGSGIDIDRRDALVYGIREGVITRIDYYNDRAEALKAVGLEE
jgi:ketosteroid isomerase-like protein